MNFYSFYDFCLIFSIFISYLKVFSEFVTFILLDKRIKLNLNDIYDNFLFFFKNLRNKKTINTNPGIRDLTLNPQVPPKFLNKKLDTSPNIDETKF